MSFDLVSITINDDYLLSSQFEAAQKQWYSDRAGSLKYESDLNEELIRSTVPDCQSRILVWGCGQGRLLGRLIQMGYRNIDALDFAPKMVDACRASYPTVTVSLLASRRTKFLPNTFACVILHELFSCEIHSDVHLRIMDDVHRVLMPGGSVVISDWLLNTDIDTSILAYNAIRQQRSVDVPYGVFRHPSGLFLRHFEDKYLLSLLTGDMPSVAADEPRFGLVKQLEHATKTFDGEVAPMLTLAGRKRAVPVVPDMSAEPIFPADWKPRAPAEMPAGWRPLPGVEDGASA